MLDKLVDIGITNGEVSVSDVEMLFPELISKSYVIEHAGTKRAAQTVEVKTLNHEKLLMLVVNAVKSQVALNISNGRFGAFRFSRFHHRHFFLT